MTARKLVYFDNTNANLTEIASNDSAILGEIQLTGIGGIGIDMGATRIQNLAEPVNATDGATKGYVDAALLGIDRKFNVAALAASNVTLSGLQTIDGYTLVAGDRVLCIGQTSAIQNGIYVAASGAWSRPSSQNDYASGTSASGDFVFVQGGSTYASQGYVCSSARGSDVVDTNATLWIQFTGPGEIVAGNGIIKPPNMGNTLAVNIASISGLQFTSGALDTLLNPAGSIAKTASGLGLTVNSNNTLATDSNGLRTLGLPSAFTIAGSPVDGNVTSTNLNTLVDGTSSLADSLHQHQNVLEARVNADTHKNGSAALAAGDPVMWSSTADTLQRCDANTAAKAVPFGIAQAAIAANASGKIVRRGVAVNVLSQATPGTAIYLAPGGGLTSTIVQGYNGSVIRMGYAKNASDLDVNVTILIQRSAS